MTFIATVEMDFTAEDTERTEKYKPRNSVCSVASMAKDSRA